MKQDRCSAVAQVAHDAEQLLRFRRGQRRGRFVEDQESQVGGQRAGDLDELKFGHGKLGDQRVRVDRDANSGERLPRPRDDRLAVDGAEAPSPGVAPMLMFSATSRCGNSFGS